MSQDRRWLFRAIVGSGILEESVVYQDIFQKGFQQGLLQGEKKIVMRQLTRMFGKLSPKVCKQIESLEAEKVEALAEALLDFQTKAELIKWLNEK